MCVITHAFFRNNYDSNFDDSTSFWHDPRNFGIPKIMHVNASLITAIAITLHSRLRLLSL